MIGRKNKQDDSLVPKVMKEVTRELNLSEAQVKHAVQHFFQWQRQAFNDLKYSKFLWNYFGTFSIIPDRYEKWINSPKYKKQQARLNSDDDKIIKEEDVIIPSEEHNQLTNNKDNTSNYE